MSVARGGGDSMVTRSTLRWGDQWLTVFAFTLSYLYPQEAKHGVFVLMTWIFRKQFPGLVAFLPDLLVGTPI